ncbi:hypothetical protein HPB52_011952 [Rhipicephalus sanguineus]|uniref:Uncharacterized protein n=1 Tax=Rhipicephalus sanguineus TaxID=34632 RepID=A0A9D4Q6F6_RHISA|nr:hypothetical protein HPB52_011952 [Rhipicephalus sanguineus]
MLRYVRQIDADEDDGPSNAHQSIRHSRERRFSQRPAAALDCVAPCSAVVNTCNGSDDAAAIKELNSLWNKSQLVA